MPLRSHPDHPAGRASLAGAVLGILLIAASVLGIVPIALRWPHSWPAVPIAAALAGSGVALIRRHMAHHRA